MTIPTQPTWNLSVQGHGRTPRLAIHNHLDGLPELGDSSLIRGNAPDSTKRLVKNVFDAYGVGKQGCFASSVGESVRLIEICAKGYNRHREPGGPKERLGVSTVAEIVVSQGMCDSVDDGTSSYLCLWELYVIDMLNGAGILHGGCIAYLIDMCVHLPVYSRALTATYVFLVVAAPPSSHLATFRERTGLDSLKT